MLRARSIDAGYGPVRVLRGLSFEVAPGEVLCVMGRNGAGKSTLCKTIMGLIPVSAGSIELNGRPIGGLPAHLVARMGIGYVPQGRRLFTELTVAENLEIGLMARRRGKAVREDVLSLFPRLRERLGQVSGSLSGGEQQMLAVARALCLEPVAMLLDEPTEGLQPSMVELMLDTVRALRAIGVATILVEQRVAAVLAAADRVAFLVNGAIVETAAIGDLAPESPLFARHVGI